MSIIQDKLKKITTKQKTLALLVLPVAVAVLFYLYLYTPTVKKKAKLEESISATQSQIAEGLVMERKLEELKTANRKLQDQLKLVAERLPAAGESPEVLKSMISGIAEGSGLSLKTWTAGLPRAGASGVYLATPVTVELVGNYHALGKLMEGIDNQARLLSVTDFTMSSAKLEGREMKIPVKFTIVAYTAAGGK